MLNPPRTLPPAGRRARPAPAALALLCAAVCLPGHAALSDTIHPYAAVTYAYDSNLLRLEDDDPEALSDKLRAVVAGVVFERPVGRQLFTGSAKVTRVSFSRFDQLDYNGKDADVNWKWQLGNNFSGNIGGSYLESLTPFADFHSSERNLRIQRGSYAEGAWRVLADWQVRARTQRDGFDYRLSTQRYLDRVERSNVVGFDYLGANGSTVGLQYTRLDGDYQNPARFGDLAGDRGFTQDKVQLKVHWKISGVTELELLAGRAERNYNVFSRLDASGTNGRVHVSWAPLGAVRFTGDLWREFSAFEGSNASYSLNKGASVGASWAATAKIQVDASYRHERRDFPGLAGSGVSLDGHDTTRGALASVTYTPRAGMQLVLSATRDSRQAGNFISSAYRAKGAALTASIQF